MTIKNKILVVGLSILVGFLSYSTYQTNKLLNEERARVSKYYDMYKEIDLEKDQLIIHADSIQTILNRYKYIIDSLDNIVVTLHSDVSYIQGELDKALDEIKEMTYDENYLYLQERYPTEDSLEFPFSGPQISRITKEVITFDYTDSLYRQYVDIAALQKAQLLYSDSIINTLKDDNNLLNLKASELYSKLGLKMKDLELSEAEVNRLKKARNLWRGGALSGGAFIILALILI